MYHVIGTGLTIILLYLLSYFFYRNNFYSKQFHSKLWNTILASAFILAALAGLFLALQINYKWNIPFIKTILKWHVEFGVGLAVTGIFHTLWHLSYFLDFFRKEDKIPEIKSKLPPLRSSISVNLFVIGLVSTSVQLLLLKEIMNISGGYELIAGTFLGSWLIGSAAGSGLAASSKLTDIRKINIYFSVSPLASILMMLILARLFMKTGETPSFLAGIIYTFLVLIPFCFVSGFTFIKLTALARSASRYPPGKSFSIETIGGIAAGILISVLSSGILSTYRALLLVILLGISYALLTFFIKKKNQKPGFRILILAAAVAIIIFPPDLFFRKLLLRGINVTESVDTQYGNITRGEYGGETSTYYDQRLLTYAGDAAEREEDIHYAMLQTENPGKVLLISGSVNSHLMEIAKYPVTKVVYVERDPELAKIEKPESFNLMTEVLVENDDAFSFVKKTGEKFDAAIVLLPPPSSLLLNRYYTYEFYKRVKESMNPGGVFTCSPGINPNYFNKESVSYYSSIYNSLKAVFTNVIPVSGNKLYFIASDKEISTAFCQLTVEKKIRNIYVGPDYLSDDLIKAKSEEIVTLMDTNVKLNRSAVPIACFYYQSFNLSKNLSEKIPAIILLIILFVMPVITIKRNNLVMYFSASALAAFEITLLLVLQLTAGNMYQLTGLIIAGIMGGLAIGSGISLKWPSRYQRALKALLLILFYVLSAVAVGHVLLLNGRVLVITLLIMSGFIPAILTGAIFRELTPGKDVISVTSSVYNADLAGSAIGFIVFSGFIIPVIGIRLSLFLLPVLIIAGFLISTSGNKH